MSKNTTELISNMLKKIVEVATVFESRWTFATLWRRDRELARRLHDQKNLFAEACVTGKPREIVDHAEALVRGYQAAARVLEQADEPDDAYMLGVDLVTGLRIAIGGRVSLERIREKHGADVVWLTPDEVARIVAEKESFKAIRAVRKVFPGAEVVDREEIFDAEGEEADD